MKLSSQKRSLFFFFFVVSFWLHAQQDPKGAEARLHRDIGALAHDSMFGREAGTPFEYKAAKYIEKSFRESKLQPYNTETGSFLDPFGFGDYKFTSSKFGINGKQLKPGVDFGAVAECIHIVKIVVEQSLERQAILSGPDGIFGARKPTRLRCVDAQVRGES